MRQGDVVLSRILGESDPYRDLMVIRDSESMKEKDRGFSKIMI